MNIELRVQRLESSVRRWQLASLLLLTCFTCIAATPGNRTITADTIKASRFQLIQGDKSYGGLYLTTIEGKITPTLALQNEKNVVYARAEPELAIFGIDCNEQPVFDVRATKKYSMLQLTKPKGGIGVTAIAQEEGGALSVVKDRQVFDFPTTKP